MSLALHDYWGRHSYRSHCWAYVCTCVCVRDRQLLEHENYMENWWLDIVQKLYLSCLYALARVGWVAAQAPSHVVLCVCEP